MSLKARKYFYSKNFDDTWESCPSECISDLIGDGNCDNGRYHVDCTLCVTFIDADGVFDGGDCNSGNIYMKNTDEVYPRFFQCIFESLCKNSIPINTSEIRCYHWWYVRIHLNLTIFWLFSISSYIEAWIKSRCQ